MRDFTAKTSLGTGIFYLAFGAVRNFHLLNSVGIYPLHLTEVLASLVSYSTGMAITIPGLAFIGTHRKKYRKGLLVLQAN